MDTSTPVVVLECHHGSLGIARSLGRLGVDVYGVDRNAQVPGLKSRYFRDAYIFDIAHASPDSSVSFLQKVGRDIGRRALLVPTSDETAGLVAEQAAVLQDWFLFPRQSPELIRTLANKRQTYYLARSLDIPTPETEFPQSIYDVCQFAERAEFPVMLKGIDGRRLFERTGKRMVITRSKEALISYYSELDEPDDPNLMLQEYIPGGDDSIWMFNGYFNERSECVAGFTGRKLRQNPVHMGSTSLGICVENEEVEQMTIEFMRAIDYTGILDIGYRYDERDGRYKLLDPNPRIGSTFRLFLAQNGMDVARFLYLDLTGHELPTAVPRQGRKWVIEDQDLESCVQYRREGQLKMVQWIRSFGGVEEAAWFAHDDLRPFWHVSRMIAARAVRWCVKRLRALAAPTTPERMDRVEVREMSSERAD